MGIVELIPGERERGRGGGRGGEGGGGSIEGERRERERERGENAYTGTGQSGLPKMRSLNRTDFSVPILCCVPFSTPETERGHLTS